MLKILEKKQESINISVVVPVFNEEKLVIIFLNRILPILESIGSYEIIFCMDPSSDNTEAVIINETSKNKNIKLLLFSRRFGQPSAVIAGINNCIGESCVVIDIDLQDPPELIEKLYLKLKEGYDVVNAKRRSRKGETNIKLFISWLGYKLVNSVTDVKIPRDTGDYRIFSRKVIFELNKLKEGHGFLRGLVAFVGFQQTYIEYDRDARAEGVSKYNRFFGSFKIALNGLVGFSNFLLTLTLLTGIVICFVSLLLSILFTLNWYFGAKYPLGIPSIIILILFMGGIQLISIGVLGEYIGRIYDEVKERPSYIIEKKYNI